MIILVLLVIGAVIGMASWFSNLQHAFRVLRYQRESGENGSLREITMTEIRTTIIGFTMSLAGAFIVTIVLTVDSQDIRMIVGRFLLLIMLILSPLMGFQIRHDSDRIKDKIKSDLEKVVPK